MISLADAQQLAEAHLAEQYHGASFRTVLLPDLTTTLKYGWLFFYNTEAYSRSRDLVDGLLGNLPLLVDARTGAIHPVPSPIDESLERYERTGSTRRP